MEETDKDLRFLSAGIEDLAQYLSSKNLFWPLSQSETPLTIGNLLFSLRRLLSNSQVNSESRNFELKLEQVRTTNRALFQKKVQAEISSRGREWENSLEDWQENGIDLPSLHTELRNRAVLELLLAEAESVGIKASLQIEATDHKFEQLSEPGAFIWEEDQEKLFPKETFWFLWRQPLGRK